MNNDLGRGYLIVHFDPATGAIRQWGFGYDFFDVPGWRCGQLPEGTNIHEIGPQHRVNLTSVEQRDGLPPLVTLTIKLDS